MTEEELRASIAAAVQTYGDKRVAGVPTDAQSVADKIMQRVESYITEQEMP